MAFNFEKQDFLAMPAFVDGNAAGNILMADEQRDTIMTMAHMNSFIDAYGTKIPLGDITKGSITMLKSVGGNKRSAKDVANLGHGTIASGQSGGFEQISAYLAKPYKMIDAFEANDAQRGLAQAAAVKFAEALTDWDDIREVIAFQALGFKTTSLAEFGVNLGTKPIDGALTTEERKAMKENIVTKAIKMKQTVKKNKGIRRVKKEDIWIDLDETLANFLVDELLIKDKADKVFQGGIWTVGHFGGFTVRWNEYVIPAVTLFADFATWLADWNLQETERGLQTLDNYPIHGFIATSFVGKSPRHFTHAEAGKLGLAPDKGYWIEQKLSGNADGTENGITFYYPDLLAPIFFGTALT